LRVSILNDLLQEGAISMDQYSYGKIKSKESLFEETEQLVTPRHTTTLHKRSADKYVSDFNEKLKKSSGDKAKSTRIARKQALVTRQINDEISNQHKKSSEKVALLGRRLSRNIATLDTYRAKLTKIDFQISNIEGHIRQKEVELKKHQSTRDSSSSSSHLRIGQAEPLTASQTTELYKNNEELRNLNQEVFGEAIEESPRERNEREYIIIKKMELENIKREKAMIENEEREKIQKEEDIIKKLEMELLTEESNFELEMENRKKRGKKKMIMIGMKLQMILGNLLMMEKN